MPEISLNLSLHSSEERLKVTMTSKKLLPNVSGNYTQMVIVELSYIIPSLSNDFGLISDMPLQTSRYMVHKLNNFMLVNGCISRMQEELVGNN